MFSLAFILVILLVISLGLLLYIYVGYPLIIVVLSKYRRQPIVKTGTLPTATIVIPAHNEEAVINQKLDNILSLDYPRELLQIIVCDDASDDRTAEIIRTYASKGIQLSEGARAGKVGALNRALGLATGQIYVITDADTILNQNSLRELLVNFSDEKVGCVVAQTRMMSSNEQETSESGGLYWRYEALIRQKESDLHSTVAATGHLMALRHEIMQPIPSNVILDDFYLAMMTISQGYRVISEPKSVVWERPTNTMGDDINRRRRLTAGRYQMVFMSREYLPKLSSLLRFQVISHKFLRLAIPHLMILALLTNILLVALLPALSLSPLANATLIALAILQGIFYGLALLGAVLSNTPLKKSKVFKIFMLPYFLCATNFASIAGLLWYFSGQHTVLWQQAKRQ
ncbi:MAG TPA: glycosyltransferase family 2 protein [Anaerolineales bacterium]|nr:glycosyltransferase family 2 protein [Anaerolineales bacterium]